MGHKVSRHKSYTFSRPNGTPGVYRTHSLPPGPRPQSRGDVKGNQEAQSPNYKHPKEVKTSSKKTVIASIEHGPGKHPHNVTSKPPISSNGSLHPQKPQNNHKIHAQSPSSSNLPRKRDKNSIDKQSKLSIPKDTAHNANNHNVSNGLIKSESMREASIKTNQSNEHHSDENTRETSITNNNNKSNELHTISQHHSKLSSIHGSPHIPRDQSSTSSKFSDISDTPVPYPTISTVGPEPIESKNMTHISFEAVEIIDQARDSIPETTHSTEVDPGTTHSTEVDPETTYSTEVDSSSGSGGSDTPRNEDSFQFIPVFTDIADSVTIKEHSGTDGSHHVATEQHEKELDEMQMVQQEIHFNEEEKESDKLTLCDALGNESDACDTPHIDHITCETDMSRDQSAVEDSLHAFDDGELNEGYDQTQNDIESIQTDKEEETLILPVFSDVTDYDEDTLHRIKKYIVPVEVTSDNQLDTEMNSDYTDIDNQLDHSTAVPRSDLEIIESKDSLLPVLTVTSGRESVTSDRSHVSEVESVNDTESEYNSDIVNINAPEKWVSKDGTVRGLDAITPRARKAPGQSILKKTAKNDNKKVVTYSPQDQLDRDLEKAGLLHSSTRNMPINGVSSAYPSKSTMASKVVSSANQPPPVASFKVTSNGKPKILVSSKGNIPNANQKSIQHVPVPSSKGNPIKSKPNVQQQVPVMKHKSKQKPENKKQRMPTRTPANDQRAASPAPIPIVKTYPNGIVAYADGTVIQFNAKGQGHILQTQKGVVGDPKLLTNGVQSDAQKRQQSLRPEHDNKKAKNKPKGRRDMFLL